MSVVVLVKAGGRDAAALPLLCGWLAVIAVWSLSAWWALRQLRLEGADGAWAQAHLDRRAGVVRSLASGKPVALGAAAWALPAVALGINLPMLLRLSGMDEPLVLTLLWLGTAALVVWICGWHLGPMLGRACFVAGLEMSESRRYVGEGFAALQSLRRRHWLGRFLAKG
jgi:hypothetical protein